MKQIKEREAAMKARAQQFLSQKTRVKHYNITGVFNEDYVLQIVDNNWFSTQKIVSLQSIK